MMKKLIPILLILFLLCGCAAEQQHSSITVDTVSQTVSDGLQTYQYQVEGEEITITSPDGSVLTKDLHTGIMIGSGSSQPDDDLMAAVEQAHFPKDPAEEPKEEPEKDTSRRIGLILIGLVLGGIFLFPILAPETACRLQTLLWVRGGEPTEFAIGYTRIAGIIGLTAILIYIVIRW